MSVPPESSPILRQRRDTFPGACTLHLATQGAR